MAVLTPRLPRQASQRALSSARAVRGRGISRSSRRDRRPRVPTDTWTLTVTDETGRRHEWSWAEFTKLPQERPTVDLHCVTRWSKFGTSWKGGSRSTPCSRTSRRPRDSSSSDATAVTPRTSPSPTSSVARHGSCTRTRARPSRRCTGGPARLLVPHLYLWKSAKWVRSIQLVTQDVPGFWEQLGYHDRGDPWREQRYQGDQ